MHIRFPSDLVRSNTKIKEAKTPTSQTPIRSSKDKEEKDKEHPTLRTLLTICQHTIAKKMEEERQGRLLSFEEIEPILEEKIEQKKEEEEDTSLIELPLPLPPLLALSPLGGSAASISGISSVEVLDFFDSLCCEMILMDAEGVSETTLFLKNEAFSQSPFFGAEITLSEFTTAPKTFNISIRASEQAVELIQSHLAGFMQLLQDRKLSFDINRIDTELLLEDRRFSDQEEKDKTHKNRGIDDYNSCSPVLDKSSTEGN